MGRPARKMVNLSIEETSGVDHPAHLHEGWLVMKAASEDAVAVALDSVGVEIPSEDKDMSTEEDVVEETIIEKADKRSYEDLEMALKKAEERISEMEKETLRSAYFASVLCFYFNPENIFFFEGRFLR